MAERSINIQQRRRSQFLTNLPVLSYDELIREKLESGKFPLTITGWIKVVGMLLLLGGLALFLGQSMCEKADTPQWYRYFFPICLGLNFGVEFILFLIFSAGWTTKRPGKWVSIDIIFNLVFSLLSIGASAATVIECGDDETMHGIPGPIGIAGAGVSLIGCAAIFLMYRYEDEESIEQAQTPNSPVEHDPRKSIFA